MKFNYKCQNCNDEFQSDDPSIVNCEQCGVAVLDRGQLFHGLLHGKVRAKPFTDGEFEYSEIIKQEYGGNNCKFSGGFVYGDNIDTVYLRFEKDGVEPYTILMRPDELQAIAWIANGVLWSDAYEKLDKVASK